MIDFETHPAGTARRLAALETDVTGYRRTLEARREASMKAVAAWRHEGSGRDLVMPDHADLVMWLLDERERLQAALAERPAEPHAAPVAAQARYRRPRWSQEWSAWQPAAIDMSRHSRIDSIGWECEYRLLYTHGALAGIENPSAVRELVEAARAVFEWDWIGLGSMPNHADWVPALADIKQLEKALAALEQENQG